MDGVTILAEHSVRGGSEGSFVFAVLFAIASLSVVCWLITEMIKGNLFDLPFNGILLVFVFVLVFAVSLFGAIAEIKEFNTFSTELEVTIDDNVSLNEFLEKYEIVDQDGQIWTVKER